MEKLDIVTIAYNEAGCIEEVVRSFYELASKYADVQIIVAEDGSTDGTRDILKRLEKELPVKLVLADERRGYAKATLDVLMATTSDTIVFVDSDGQFYPEDLKSMLDAMQGYHMVSGVRPKRGDSAYRGILSWLNHLIVWLLFKVPFKDMDTGYRVMRRELALSVAPECRLLLSYWTEFAVRAYKKGFKLSAVLIRHRERLSGETKNFPVTELPFMVLRQVKGLWTLYMEFLQSLSNATDEDGE